MKKKSGAAQRLVSLVLALGLIFTLAPASVFAGDEVPASSTVTAIADEEPVVDSTEPAVDGTEPVVDDSEPVADSTEPAEEPAVEQDALKPAKVAAPAPAALGSASPRGDYGISFIFSNDSSDGVRLWYATREYDALGVHFEVSELKELTRGDSLDFAMLEGRAAYFFVYIPEGYELDELQISESLNAYETLPLTDGYKLEEFEGRQAEAMAKGCTYGFYFSGTGNLKNTEITVTTKPITNIYTVDKSQDFESTGVDIVEELPVEVKEGESLQLTVYGPNELGVTKLIQSLTVLDGTEEKALQLPLNADDTPAVTQLNGGKVTVTYHDVEMVNGLLRTKYTIDVTNVRGDITFNSVACRKWVEKAVNVNELEGIAALEYCGPDGKWQSFDVNSLPDRVPFFTCNALDFIEGHYQVVNFRFKLQDGYENPQLKLTKKNGTIDKGELMPDAYGWYNFNITIGAKWTGDDILVWFGDNTYQVDMRLTAQPKTSYEAKFYIHEKDKTAASDYTFVGTGSVSFGAPAWKYANNPIKLDSTNLDKVTEPSPLTFPDIEVDGVKYTYSADPTAPGTYNFVGWEVAKAAYLDQSGPDAILEWHVDGIIEVNPLPEFSNEMKPEVVGTTAVYNGNAHGLTINYKENYPERYFKVTYEVWNKDTETWNELPLGQVPTQTEAGRMDVRVTFEYRFPEDPHLPLTVETSIVVMPRPLDLTVQDVTILKGETPTFTVIPSAEGENTGLLTSLGHTLTDDWKVNEDYNNEVAGEYTITLKDNSWVIEDAAGNNVSNNYSVRPVAGKLTVKAPLPAALQPTVGNTSSTYDGQAHGLYISYPDGTSASDYKVEYQIAGGAWSETAPSLTNVDKVENVKVRFTYGNYATYEAPGVYSVEVTKRPLTLKVNDDKITDGEPIPSFTYAITAGSVVSGQSITGVTYGGYTDELGIYDVTIKTFKIVAGSTDVTGNYDVTLLPGVFTIGTSGGGGTTPTPDPNPNPTPVPVPVEPETPVTPVAPVTPDEEEEEPAEVEDIEDEETPQASPDTDADKEEDKTENIEDEETAQAGAPGEGNWALLNLILMVLTVVAGLAMLALRFARKTGMAHLLGIVPAIVALVAFFVTEDMSLPMAMTDKWTLIMALIAVVQVVLLVLGRNGAQEDDQPREQY